MIYLQQTKSEGSTTQMNFFLNITTIIKGGKISEQSQRLVKKEQREQVTNLTLGLLKQKKGREKKTRNINHYLQPCSVVLRGSLSFSCAYFSLALLGLI